MRVCALVRPPIRPHTVTQCILGFTRVSVVLSVMRFSPLEIGILRRDSLGLPSCMTSCSSPQSEPGDEADELGVIPSPSATFFPITSHGRERQAFS